MNLNPSISIHYAFCKSDLSRLTLRITLQILFINCSLIYNERKKNCEKENFLQIYQSFKQKKSEYNGMV